MTTIQKIIGGLFVIVLVLCGVSIFSKPAPFTVGSVQQGGEYTSTTTNDWGNAGTFDKQLKTGSGTFGSVVVTINAATRLRILDANGLATTTLASFVSPTVGTYTFDANFYRGLYAIVDAGGASLASTTITWR